MYAAKSGFIALISAIVISTVLLGLALTAGASGVFSRFDALNAEYKRVSLALAESCSNAALLKVAQNYNYVPAVGGDTIQLGVDGQGRAETCVIRGITYGANHATVVQDTAVITTQAQYPSPNGALSSVTISATIQNPKYAVPARATIFVQTTTLNDDGGTKQPGDFLMTATGGNVSPATFAGSAAGVVVYIDPGPFTISGSNDGAYSKNTGSSCAGSLSAGGVANCVIAYNDIPTTASLTVIATVFNDDGGTKQPSDFQLFIDGIPSTSGVPLPGLAPGTHTATAAATPAGYHLSTPVWGTHCLFPGTGTISLAAGEKRTCTIIFDDDDPPAPICVDTVLMLDRTGSMGTTDLQNERAAANGLLNLYAALSPLPKSSVGVFGAINANEPFNAAIMQGLTTAYSSLASAVNSGLANSDGYTNLASAISVSQAEMAANGTPGKGHIIILLSDGGANRPTGTQTADTGYASPTVNAQDNGGELWSNPSGAYADAGGDASDPVSENDQHRFYNFNFPTIPAGATITGIEALADAWATTATLVPTPGVAIRPPSAPVAITQWTNVGNAYTSNDVYTTDAVNGHQQGYGNFGFTIPANATITGIQIATEAKVSGGATTQTGTLTPNGQGSDTSWNNNESDIDEAGTPDCSGGDSIDSNNNGNRESVNIDLSSVPNGSIVTSVQVQTWDQMTGGSGGQYQTYVRVDGGTRTDSGVNLITTSSSGCTARSQTIDIADFTKGNGTDLEVGVLKVGNTTARVGALRAVVSYIPATTGSVTLSVSSNNGGAWTAAKSTTLNNTESVASPSGNNATDMWGRTWVPADFADGKFAVRIQNNSTSGTTVSLDQVTVTVNYTAPAPAPTACDLRMDVSWNGGSTWSSSGFGNSERSVTLTNTEATYTLGSSGDDWTNAHTWVASDFTNSNFRARVHAVDPGSGCDSAAVDHLDWLRMKVHYTTNVDPFELALQAADAAKLAGTEIFTIHFGDKGSGNHDINFLANIANGGTAVAGHQPGSVNDLSGSAANGSVGFSSPTSAVAPNQFTNPTRAYSSDNSYATDSTNGHQQGYGNFGFVVPGTATVAGIEVSVEAKSSDNNGCQVGAEVSWDGGATFTNSGNVASINGSDNTYTLGGTTNLWGRTWSPSDFINGKFVVRIRNIDPGSNCSGGATLSVDRVQARVSYTGAVPENTDGDHFFVSPNSSDMPAIFRAIGEEVCPALTTPPPAAPPTHGKLLVITHVVNDNGGTNSAADFGISLLTGLNPVPSGFPVPGAESPGIEIQLDPGSYSVDEDLGALPYTKSAGTGCSGTIAAGQTLTCTFTTDDLPPPPPSSPAPPTPPSTIIIGSWSEGQ